MSTMVSFLFDPLTTFNLCFVGVNTLHGSPWLPTVRPKKYSQAAFHVQAAKSATMNVHGQF